MNINSQIDGVILAGGQARRMHGKPKHRLLLNGTSLLQQSVKNADPQVNNLLLSFNDEADEETLASQLPLLADSLPGHLGPLAGILSAMEWCQKNSAARWLASFAVDTPLFPEDLVSTLAQHQQGHTIVCPRYGNFRHPTFCLWKIDQANDLRHWLQQDNGSRMGAWLQQQQTKMVTITESVQGLDPFTNINSAEDLEQLNAQLTSHRSGAQ